MGRRVIGIGGVFFRTKNPTRLAKWYRRHLGLSVATEEGQTMSVFRWRHSGVKKQTGMTIWAPFPAGTRYFGPSRQSFMINYIVEDLDRTLLALRRERVEVVGGVDESQFGRFAWIRDVDGHRLELWEPPRPA
ncbi:MAG: VOC family protein [Thermoplasmata archaeon]|nr:VOC family protein [Thermoplasmata archaeon]